MSDQPGPTRKSLNLPAGLVGRRTRPSKLDVTEPDLALAWARTHCPDAIQTQEKLSKSALNQPSATPANFLTAPP